MWAWLDPAIEVPRGIGTVSTVQLCGLGESGVAAGSRKVSLLRVQATAPLGAHAIASSDPELGRAGL